MNRADTVIDAGAQEPSVGLIWKLAWPVMVASLTHMLYHLVDLYWIGLLGSSALAAVSVCGPITMFFFLVGRVVNAGGVSLMSRSHGAGDREATRRWAADTLLAGLLLGTALALAMYHSIERIIGFYGLDEQTYRHSLEYIYYLILSAPVWFLSSAVNSYFFAVGRTKVPMYIGIVTNIFNALLDPFLMFGWLGLPAMGVRGAAASTFVSSLLALVLGLSIQARSGGLGRPSMAASSLGHILRIGIPVSTRDVNFPLVGFILFKLVAVYGTTTVAAFGLARRMLGLVFIYIGGLNVALTTLCGNALGAGRKEIIPRLLLKGALFGLMFHSLVGTMMFAGAPALIGAFSDEAPVISEGTLILRILVFMMLFVMGNKVLGAVFNASGRTMYPLYAAMCGQWGLLIPAAWYVSSHGLSSTLIWLSILASRGVELSLLLWFFKAGRWTPHAPRN